MLKIGRITSTFAAFVIVSLTSLEPPVMAGGYAPANSSTHITVAKILAAPDAFAGEKITIQGTVISAKRVVFPNGRPYYALSVGDESASLTVFSWARPAVKEGDLVKVVGAFHIWRYNLHHMIESIQITRLAKTR